VKQQAVRLALRTFLETMAGLPTSRAWENVAFTPTTGTTWIAESYLPGPARKITLGALGEMETLPQYVVQVNVASNAGVGTADGLVDDILTHFAPETSITVTGATLRVRGDTAPFASQLIQSAPGFATVTINIPLRLRAANVI